MGLCTPWITAADILERVPSSDEKNRIQDSGVLPSAALDACNILYALSGRQFPGTCSAILRPTGPYGWGCSHQSVSMLPDLVSRGVGIDSYLAATNGGSCGDGGITLGLYPIKSVTTIKINGVTLDPSTYRVDDQRYLVRPGVMFWPFFQRIDLPDTASPTFSVAVTYGADPPSNGPTAAAAFGVELARYRAGMSNRLPARVTSLTRQGVTVSAIDQMSYLKEGLTGLYEVDIFLTAYNPGGQTRRPIIWSPEAQSRRRM